MHELSIASAIVAIAERHAAGRRVIAVEVRVGHLRQVVPDSLAFAFELVAEGRCRVCATDGPLTAFPLQCAACGGLDVEVIRGEELLVDSLELEEEEMAHGC